MVKLLEAGAYYGCQEAIRDLPRFLGVAVTLEKFGVAAPYITAGQFVPGFGRHLVECPGDLEMYRDFLQNRRALSRFANQLRRNDPGFIRSLTRLGLV